MMEFDNYRDLAANYLEDAGIAYSPAMDDRLWALYSNGTKAHEVIKSFQ